jgi:hypothetical protein
VIARLAAVVLALGTGVPAAEAPRIGPLPTQSPPAQGGDEAPARRLPRTVAVCRDRASGRCFTAADGSACGADVFRVVIDGPDVAVALEACRTEAAGAAGSQEKSPLRQRPEP